MDEIASFKKSAEKTGERVTAWVSVETAAVLKAKADAEDRSVSWIMAKILTDAVGGGEKEAA